MLMLLLLLCTPIHRSITITITSILVSLRPIDRKSNSQIIIIIIIIKQARTTSSGSMIESMLTKRQRETQREQECINKRE